ncbi:OLC1v1026881C1 [Oldenlandia corymbosa var. corymbosa]|uniref:Multiple inositol polyphosphate phosphatase 1 n=1 Tax=Oldenlandia corymbosa var. corymbosa TaxID=529605 RepID=A0AAV1CA15_OLDCO|nr:OLC1v1026881C1 [Oldenlandia corymbosa var. corymbosa]
MIRLALIFTILLICFSILSGADETFDVRRHLATVSRYGVIQEMASDSFVPSQIPDECTPIHLNLVARHGTRAPTKKKMKEFDALESRMEYLLQELKEQKESLNKIPAWLWEWKSPWKGKRTGGELIRQGEDDLYHLGIRIREKFPQLFDEDYHPDIYPIKATQVPRASASAVAFGMGLFSGKGNLGPGRHRAFSVISESRASDTMLRFHDCCQNYKGFRKSQAPAVDKLKEPVLDEITGELVRRYGLNFTRKDTSSLWSLCKQEASLLEITNQACALFTPSEVALLEWTDDLETFILKGYGNSLNYRMGVPLLQDVIQSMEQAINAKEEGYVTGSFEKARMRVAHAETLVPFSCLLGLFLEGPEFEQILREESLQLPPKPSQRRNWRSNVVAPFAGNNILVLYGCQNDKSTRYFVHVLHNEHPVPLPGCNNSDFCPFEVFKQVIAAPHLKHNYETLCNANEKSEEKLTTTPRSWLSSVFAWLCSWKKVDVPAYSEL